MNQKKKAIILGWYGFGNLGDELLLDATLNYFSKHFDYFYYHSPVDLNKKNAASFYLGRKRDILAFFFLTLQIDILILGGGSYLRDLGSKKNLIIKLLLLSCAVILRKKIVFFGSGLGPFSYNRSNLFLKWLLLNVTYASFRDNRSAELYRHITHQNALVVPDPVLLLFENRIINKRSPQKKEYQNIAFALREWHDSNMENDESDHYCMLIQSIKELILKLDTDENNIKITFLIFQKNSLDHMANDDVIYQTIVNQIDIPNFEIKLLPHDLDEIDKTYKDIDILIGMRLHSLILGSVYQIPMIGIAYDDKVDGFMESINLSKYVIQYTDITPALLLDKYLSLSNQEYSLKSFYKLKDNLRNLSSIL